MASPSSSEQTGKPHPYQYARQTGSPTGAFEARRVRAGLYIRVDMPGVPNDAVKVVKYDETNTVTFSGKAPPVWAGFESPETRIYAGYVVLDRQLSDVDFVTQIKNGCLRMFFPLSDGSLHFLSPPSSSSVHSNSVVHHDVTGEDEEDKFNGGPLATLISHDPQNPSGITLTGGTSEHINPYLLSGVKGVYEHKIVTLDNGNQLIYLRLDVPDTCMKSAGVMENYQKSIMFAAMAIKKEYYSRFDEAAREYYGLITPTCECCNYNVTKFEIASGVLRLLVHKSRNDDVNPRLFYHMCVTPSRHGRLQPSIFEIFERVTPSLRRRPSRRRTGDRRRPAVQHLFPSIHQSRD
ncbi:hypothetical protein RND81_11G047200 [Saponaria officinalis]|uniref:SHSP domain-containing protein n=1 Tax=Saponaria officinalis TaxID=3572 RepID=A0AAW1HHY8_SAPOF